MAKKNKDDSVIFECVGFMFITGRPNFTDPEDFLDCRNMAWTKEALECDLNRGVMPPGMLVKAVNGSKIGIVVGNYNEEQRVELLSDRKYQLLSNAM